MKKYLNFILSRTTDKDFFKLEFKKGNEMWRNSIWLTYWWFGRNYWLIIFI
jgi:hypothetical protein